MQKADDMQSYDFGRIGDGARWVRCLTAVFVGLGALALGGCATTNGIMPKEDKFEGLNRPIHSLNHGLDTVFLRPVAEAYVKVMPKPAQQGVGNFFRNLGEPNTMLNNALQGKGNHALSDGGRFVINSTIGMGGLFDVAQEMGLKRHKEDLGQTLATWGVGPGPYLVAPLMGPMTLRELPGRVLGGFLNPFAYVDNDTARIVAGVVGTINTRAELIPTIELVDESALDRYLYVREAYLQDRMEAIYDGDPPLEELFEDDLFLDEEEFEEEE